MNDPAFASETGDTMRKSALATPERIVTCHTGITLQRAVELSPSARVYSLDQVIRMRLRMCI